MCYLNRAFHKFIIQIKLIKMQIVDEQLLMQLTECDSFEEIRVLCLRYNGKNTRLTHCMKLLSKCPNLTVLYLQHNLMNLKDLNYLQSFENLKKIDLSDNNIDALPQQAVFAGLKSLQFLYLHENRISKWQDLQSLTALPTVMHITLFANPVCSIPGYRHFVVNSVPGLKALDNFVITDEERIEDASFGYRFRGLNEFMKLHIPEYKHEPSAEQHLFNLEVDVYRLKRIFERNSPSILIQSLYRGHRSRNINEIYFKEKKKKIIRIQCMVRGWLSRRLYEKNLRDLLERDGLQDLLLTNQQIRERDASKVIGRVVLKWFLKVKKDRREWAACMKIQTFFKMRFVKNTSFVNALEISRYPRIYFLKEQKPILIKILRSQEAIFNQNNMTSDEAFSYIREDVKYQTIRVEEPDLFTYKPLPLLQFTMPTFGSKSIIRHNNSLMLDERTDPDFTLNNYLFTDDKEFTDQSLNNLKKRYCKPNLPELRAHWNKMKGKDTLNQMVFFDKYNDFLVFDGPNYKIVIQLLFAILDYNRNLDKIEDQQFLCFFEPLLEKACAATKIQQAFRAHRFRRTLSKLPVYDIIERRAAYCIQDWWRNLRLRKRMQALSNIGKHVAQINSNEIYIEQTLYNNINAVVSVAHNGFRFEEQQIMFDFNPTTFGIYMQTDEDPIKPVKRFNEIACPKWMKTRLCPPSFDPTPYVNNLQAFFHFNQGDCSVVPSTSVMNYDRCKMYIDRKLYFLKIVCSSVEEARKRAITMAYLTYDMTRHLFLKLSTGKMLEDPFINQNIYDCHELYSIEIPEQEVDVKANIPKQLVQTHQGMILTDKDARTLQTSDKFKSVELNEKFLNISVRDNVESAAIDREIANFESQAETSGASGTVINPFVSSAIGSQAASDVDATLQLSLYDARKIQEENLAQMKEQRWMHINRDTQLYRAEKQMQAQLFSDTKMTDLERKKMEVTKHREIQRIIKQEQQSELDKNLNVFLNLNKEEKILRQELVDKQQELQSKEKQLKIANVVHRHKVRHLKREEREKFVGSFAQAKNLIEKQMKMGNHIRALKKNKEENKKKVTAIKLAKAEDQMALPLKTKVYGGFEQSDISTQRSSANAHGYMTSQMEAHRGRSVVLKSGIMSAPDTSMMYNSVQQPRRNVDWGVHTRGDPNNPRYLSAQRNKKESRLLPPLYDTTFSEQYKHYQMASGGQTPHAILPPIGPIGSEMEVSRDLDRRIVTQVPNRPYLKRSYQKPGQPSVERNVRPIFTEERYAMNTGGSVFKVGGQDQGYYQEQLLNPNTFLQSNINVPSQIDVANSSMGGPDSTGLASHFLSPMNPAQQIIQNQ